MIVLTVFPKYIRVLWEDGCIVGLVLYLTANIRFRLRLHPNCLWSQAPDGNFLYLRNVVGHLSGKGRNLVKILFDSKDKKDKIGDQFRRIYNDDSLTNSINIVSPYISDCIAGIDMRKLGRYKTAKILCNIDNPSCNPYIVHKIVKEKWADIRTRNDIHAKVYIFDKEAIISSANFTPNGLGIGNIDAGVLLQKSETAPTITWFNELWNDTNSLPLSDLSEDKWRELKARWDNRNVYTTNASRHMSHFLDLLLTDTLKNVVFVFWHESGIITSKSKVKKIGNEKLFPIPDDEEQWDYWVEDTLNGNENPPKNLTEEFKKHKHCMVINVKCKMENGLYKQFYKAEKLFASQFFGKMLPFYDTKKKKTEIVSYYKIVKKSSYLDFSLSGAKSKEFIELLNKSIDINGKLWKMFANSDSGKMGFCTPMRLRRLLKGAF